MPHPYAQDDDALINPLEHDDWPTPEKELLAKLATTPSGEIYARLPSPEWDGLIALGYATIGQDFGACEADDSFILEITDEGRAAYANDLANADERK